MDNPTFRPGHVNGRCDRDSRHGRRAQFLLREPRGDVLAAVAIALVLTTAASQPVARVTSIAAPAPAPLPVAGLAAAAPAIFARPLSASLLPTLPPNYGGNPLPSPPPRISAARGNSPLRVVGPTYVGLASWYGPGFQGRRTANGERFDTQSLTAANKTLPFGTWLRVCRGTRCVVVRVNDRGPYVRGRFLDLSSRAAHMIGLDASGVCRVTATVVASPRATTGSTWASARG